VQLVRTEEDKRRLWLLHPNQEENHLVAYASISALISEAEAGGDLFWVVTFSELSKAELF
jgi:hypothetical protein